MYKRLELHNHTNESDAVFTCKELTDFMVADQVDAFALTDHNTISGHCKIKNYLKEHPQPIDFIPGMEYTTYYGHILCLNLTEYVPWENINRHKPELLFRAARKKGALVGVAHPYSFGWPFAQGCRFEMTITDYSCCDFIEIFNNPEPLHEVNEKGVKLWENLVLSGEKLAATCGMAFMATAPCTDITPPTSRANRTAMSARNSPMRSITSVPGYARDLCWKYITMEKHSPSPSTRPENRGTNRSPGMITRSPSAPKIGSSPAMSPTRSRWLLLQSMLLLSRCFSRKKPLSKTSYVQAL